MDKKVGVAMNEASFEKMLNIATTEIEYGFPKIIHYHRYEPTPYEGLEKLFSSYEMPCNSRLVDVGCGKGRVPIYVHYKFQIPVVGIEMDVLMYKMAMQNKNTYMRKVAKGNSQITFVNMLAQQYEIDEFNNVFFFFNPFSIQIFRKVVQNILRSFEKNPRIIDIILYYPAQDYLHFLSYETNFKLIEEVDLDVESNINERICVFRLST